MQTLSDNLLIQKILTLKPKQNLDKWLDSLRKQDFMQL